MPSLCFAKTESSPLTRFAYILRGSRQFAARGKQPSMLGAYLPFAKLRFARVVAPVRRRIKNKGHQWYPMSYGMLELFAASGKRTIFLDFLRHHFASKDGIIALSEPSVRAGSSHRVVGGIKNIDTRLGVYIFYGADYGARTRHLRLGKATLYQMS